jgi:hypothetical protein
MVVSARTGRRVVIGAVVAFDEHGQIVGSRDGSLGDVDVQRAFVVNGDRYFLVPPGGDLPVLSFLMGERNGGIESRCLSIPLQLIRIDGVRIQSGGKCRRANALKAVALPCSTSALTSTAMLSRATARKVSGTSE